MIDPSITTALVASPFSLFGIAFGIVGAALVIAGLTALVRGRPLGFAFRTLAGLLLLSLGALVSTIAIGAHGYRALTREDVAARLFVRPVGAQRFTATVRFPDASEKTFEIAGDQVYIDARILKWKPVANILGLHTAYELDRVAGRYHSIEQERSAPRTVFPLGQDRPVDLFSLRQRYTFLEVLLDAEYGSATFAQVTRPTVLEVRVSTTGLLMREVPK